MKTKLQQDIDKVERIIKLFGWHKELYEQMKGKEGRQ